MDLLSNPFPGLVFLDFESSGLIRPSYPIQVGIARCDLSRDFRYIRPAEHWLDWEWQWEAQNVHNITQSDLTRFGRPVEEVVDWLDAQLAGMTVVSDNPQADGYWGDQLYIAAGRGKAPFDLVRADELVLALLDQAGRADDYEAIRSQVSRRHRITHRAEEDALHWAAFLLEARRLMQEQRDRAD